MKRWTSLSIVSASLCVAGVAMAQQDKTRTGADAYGDWSTDAPGVTRLIRPNDLPPPGPGAQSRERASSSSEHKLNVPNGFAVARFSPKLEGVRVVRIAPNGDVFAARTSAGQVDVMRPNGDHAGVGKPETFASGLQGPFGIAFYPPGPNPQW